MPRVIPLLSGLALASVVIYKVKTDLEKDQGIISSRINEAKSALDRAVTKEEYKRGPSYLDQSQNYVSKRLVPSVKDNWNHQIMNASKSLVKVDIGSKIQEGWNKYVIENVKEALSKK